MIARRSGLRFVLLVLVPLALACGGEEAVDTSAVVEEAAQDGGDWPLFRGDLQQTGVARSSLAEDLELKWTFEAEGDIESTAAVVGGTVYVGTLEGHFYALDLEDGSLQWTFEAGEEIKSSASVWEDTVYFGDEMGFFHALDRGDGSERWKFESYAGIISGATFDGDNVLFGSYDNSLYCLTRGDGALQWKVETDGYVHGTPSIADGMTTVSGCDGFLWLIDLEDGSVVEKIDLQGQSASSPAVIGERAFVGTYNNEVLGLDLAARRVLWRYEHPERKFPYYASAASDGDVVVIGGRDKIVHALDAETGVMRWTYPSGARIDSSAVIVGERVFITTTRGEVLGLTLSSGERVWGYDTGSAFTASPAVADGRMVVGSLDGVVYCFG